LNFFSFSDPLQSSEPLIVASCLLVHSTMEMPHLTISCLNSRVEDDICLEVLKFLRDIRSKDFCGSEFCLQLIIVGTPRKKELSLF
jgi:hypothetical protein